MLHERKRAVLLAPDDAELRFALAEALYVEGALADAAKQLEHALRIDPQHANAQRLAVRVAAELGQAPGPQAQHGHPEAWPELARAFAARGRLDDAILYAEAAALARGADVPQWLLIAEWCVRARLPARALRAFGRAIRLSQREPGVIEERDRLLSKLGLDGAVEVLSESPEGVLATAAEAVLEGRLRDAKRELAAADASDRTSATFDCLRAEILWLEGEPAKAAQAEAKARAKDRRLHSFAAGTHRAHAPGAAAGRIGVLGWTPVGGAVSPMEALVVQGQGVLRFTGNVGESGREAGLIAYTCLRAMARSLDIDGLVASLDLHLHFTDIEIGKEGLSSGLALALAGLSAFRRRALAARLGATGAITLHGEVQRVDGIYEKAVAAKLHGLACVLYPRANGDQVRGLPPLVTAGIRWLPVSSFGEAVQAAFEV